MRKVRLLCLSAVIAVAALVPTASPAYATHACGIEEPREANELCESAPHTLFDSIEFLICKLLPTC